MYGLHLREYGMPLNIFFKGRHLSTYFKECDAWNFLPFKCNMFSDKLRLKTKYIHTFNAWDTLCFKNLYKVWTNRIKAKHKSFSIFHLLIFLKISLSSSSSLSSIFRFQMIIWFDSDLRRYFGSRNLLKSTLLWCKM